MPYLPVSLAEKQHSSRSTRSSCGISRSSICSANKDDINIRIEMAKKVSDRVNKSNREAMLREQLKVIQEELNEARAIPVTAGTGNGSNNRRCRTKFVKKLWQRRKNSRPVATQP